MARTFKFFEVRYSGTGYCIKVGNDPAMTRYVTSKVALAVSIDHLTSIHLNKIVNCRYCHTS